MHLSLRLLIMASLGMMFCSCETTATKPADGEACSHGGRYDYWEHGGGACCPKHAGKPKKP